MDNQTKHTPEPWEANTRRIVACVNACKGISTAALESGMSVVHTAQKNHDLRDELADMLDELVNVEDWEERRERVIARAKILLAKVAK